MASMPMHRMGPPPRSLAAEAHGCFMVRIPVDPTDYKVAAQGSRPKAGSPRNVRQHAARSQERPLAGEACLVR